MVHRQKILPAVPINVSNALICLLLHNHLKFGIYCIFQIFLGF